MEEEGRKASMACEHERDCVPRRTSSRKQQIRTNYVPAENLRNRATPPNKKARRNKYRSKRGRPSKARAASASTKKVNKKKAQTTLRFPPTQQKPLKRAQELSLSQRIAGNTSLELGHLMQLAVKLASDFPTEAKIEFPRYRCELCKCYFQLQRYRKDNFQNHLTKDRSQQKGSLLRWFGNKAPIQKAAVKIIRPIQTRISPDVVCEGFWRRQDPFTGMDLGKVYHESSRDWYGVPKHRLQVLLTDGSTREMEGTYRSTRCMKLALKFDGRTPNGTMMCNHCARVPTLQSFVTMVKQAGDATTTTAKKRTRNTYLTLDAAKSKLHQLSCTIKVLRQKCRRQIKRRRTETAKEALVRNDVKKLTKELQFIAQRGTLEDKKTMWSYIKDVVHNEFLVAKRGPTGKHGMRWSSDSKDFAASQKLMAGKRLPQHTRENIGGPSMSSIARHLREVRMPCIPGPAGVVVNMQAVRKIWQPIIIQRREKDPTLRYIFVELSEDETGILAKIEYWREKDSILGSCGYRGEGHKCNDQFHPVIGTSWQRLVDIMSKAIPSSYLRTIMVNPLCDWLPAMVVLANATCNKFDHVPHVSDQWKVTLNAFNQELRPLGCLYSSRGSDGDGRRFKLQYEVVDQEWKRLKVLRNAAIKIQRRWRRPNSLCFVVNQLDRRSTAGVHQPVGPPCNPTFTVPISLEGAKGFQFASRATYKKDTGAIVDMTSMPSQDSKHKGKRIDMPLQSAAKTMIVGDYVASATDLFLVRKYMDDDNVRKLRTSDLRRDDRQNFAAVVRRSGKLVINILELLQQGTANRRAHKTQGTVAVYKMLSRYLLIFFGIKLSLADRVKFAAYVCHFLRLWHVSIRTWPDKSQRNVGDNFYPMQTFRHVLLSCQSAVMFIMACGLLTPTQVCGLALLGSDCCEILYSMIGGWGILCSWQRGFTFRGALFKITDANALRSIASRGNVNQQKHRNKKAGEFDNRLHEDMTLPDADLTSYPAYVIMVTQWNSGVASATADCLRLGMKHADVPNDLWNCPWKADPPNPPVIGFDDYVGRKYGKLFDLSNQEDEDDDDQDDNQHDEDDDSDDDNDPMVQQVQLDFAITNIRNAVENEDDKGIHMIKTPNGRWISKETAIVMLREAFDTDGKISKDRLKRIVQCAQRSRQDVSKLPEFDDASIELHKDVALAFNPGRGKPLELYFGRVKKMVVVSATGRRSLRLMSISVDKMPEGLSVMCTYYTKVPRRQRTYRYGKGSLETDLYKTTSLLCVVNFDYNPRDDTYVLSRDQWTDVREELKRLQNKR